jgi:hypothetical protein
VISPLRTHHRTFSTSHDNAGEMDLFHQLR